MINISLKNRKKKNLKIKQNMFYFVYDLGYVLGTVFLSKKKFFFMSFSSSFDNEINEFLTEKEKIDKWAHKIINGLTTNANPYFSNIAHDFSLLPWFDKNPIIELFARDVTQLNFNSMKIPDLPNYQNRKLNFLSDLKIDQNYDETMKNNQPLDITRALWYDIKPDIIKPPVDLSSALQMKTTSFLEIEITKFQTKQPLFEPIFFVCYLYNGEDFVTEPWVYLPPQSTSFLKKEEQNQSNENENENQMNMNKAVFRYNTFAMKTKLYVVFIIYHMLPFKQGSSIIGAYYKGDKAIQQPKNVINQTNNSEVTGSFCTLGYMISPLQDLLESSSLPYPTICTQNITPSFIKKLLIDNPTFDSPKENKLGLYLNIHVSARELDDKSVLIHQNIIGTTKLPVKEPVLNFRHQMILKIGKAYMRMPFMFTESVYCVVSLKNGIDGDFIPLLSNMITKDKASSISSISLKASKELYFNNNLMLDFPLKIEKDTILLFEFYGLITKKNNLLREKIGYSIFPLVNEETGFPQSNGVYKLIIYDIKDEQKQLAPEKVEQRNKLHKKEDFIIPKGKDYNGYYCEIYIEKRSLLFPETVQMNELYASFAKKTFSLDLFQKCSEGILLRSSFPLFDILMSNFLSNPNEIMKIFCYLSQIAQKNCPKQFDRFLDVFSTIFAFSHFQSQIFHTQLLKEWTNIIREDMKNEKLKERRDLYLINFFFVLIIKSLYIFRNNDKPPQSNQEADENIEQNKAIQTYHPSNDEFLHVFPTFAINFGKSVVSLNHIEQATAQKILHFYSMFLLQLFDIGYYSFSIQTILNQMYLFSETKEDFESALFFLESVLQPKLFASSVLFMDLIIQFFVNFLEKIIKFKEIGCLRIIFKILNYNIACLFQSPSNDDKEEDLQHKICDRLIPLLTNVIILIYNKKSIKDDLNKDGIFTFCSFIFTKSSKTNFLQWFNSSIIKQSKELSDNQNMYQIFFKSIHYMIDYFVYTEKANDNNQKKFSLYPYSLVQTQKNSQNTNNDSSNEAKKERAFAIHNSIIHLLSHLHEVNIENGEITKQQMIDDLIYVFYHLFSSNIELSIIPTLISLFTKFTLLHFETVIYSNKVPFTKFVIKILELSIFAFEESHVFFAALLKTDYEVYNNNNRINAIIQRSVYLLNEEVILSLKPEIFSLLNTTNNSNIQENILPSLLAEYQNIIKMQKENPQNEIIENAQTYIFKKFLLFSYSPDSQFQILDDLQNFHKNNEYSLEEVQTRFLQESIIIEYLSFIGLIHPNCYSINTKHAALVYELFCPYVRKVIPKDDFSNDLPLNIPSFCDSPPFNMAFLTNHIIETIMICTNYKLNEYALHLSDVIIPLLEESDYFSLLSITSSKISDSIRILSQIPVKDDRLLGMFYRVGFYGEFFGEDDGKEFIYREKNLTNIYNFSKRLTEDFKRKYPGKRIEIIKESAPVNTASLEKGTGYIQITSVDPFMKKFDRKNRKTQFEQKTRVPSFYFDTPFVKGSSKAQGNVDEQWHRRTVFMLDTPIPWVIKRQEIRKENVKVIEYEPCIVSYRMMKMRIEQMKEAIQNKAYSSLQSLLNGSLMASVNGGPIQIAEAFLTKNDNNNNQEKQNQDTDKAHQKLKNIFKEFLVVNTAGLKTHADYVATNPLYLNLQHELENQLTIISDELKNYL